MQFTRIKHLSKRFFELGARQSFTVLRARIEQKTFELLWRPKAQAKKAYHTWHKIQSNHNSAQAFEHFFKQLSFKQLPDISLQSPKHAILEKANEYSLNTFDLLGSGTQTFNSLPWHEDFRLKAQSPQADNSFDRSSFYKDILIHANDSSNLAKDIKVPWELSRCRHLVVLGKAYQLSQNITFAQTFTSHIHDWINHNPYLIGINWVCPMEVGIRALNWIWAWNYFKDSSEIESEFWQTFTCSLYDHAHYLEHNWEIYDGKTNNHYLSGLVGYFYLCFYFQDFPGFDRKKAWCYEEIIKEFNKQIFDEGTSYEGSTAYHNLVTELLWHFKFLCETQGMELPNEFHQKFERMREFSNWCMMNEQETVKIGDDDSGTVLDSYLGKPVRKANIITQGIKTYPHFGLSIIKSSPWHVTLRHYAYKKHQSSGHFHNDTLSITLAVNGIPIFIDPGSYVYTPSAAWRNHFRSVKAHNTFFLDGHEPAPFDDRMFALELPEALEHHSARNKQDIITLSSSHALYKRFDLEAHRTISIKSGELEISDFWTLLHNKNNNPLKTTWNFTLHPEIVVVNHEGTWVFVHQQEEILHLQSAIEFSLEDGWMAHHYGNKLKTTCLKGQQELSINETKSIRITTKKKR